MAGEADKTVPEIHDHIAHTGKKHSHDTGDNINEGKTLLVVIITALAMTLEIGFGYHTKSMALLADGYHMSSHVFVIGLSWLAYVAARKYASSEKISFRKEKLLALTGFTSAIVLQIVAIIMVIESVDRIVYPVHIKFMEAIIVAIIGLVVNIISAFLLKHDDKHGDYNIKAAYVHVISDAMTSIIAIAALLAGMYSNMYSLDAISGIISALVITRWAVAIIKDAGKELIEFKRK
ncbi:MAG TPA: cation diffusion facilitator family transporter [Flavipsychrobacter sp.]|nr:cation diffusion facilitator family transporter [Flavipsychrobacter sp.]